MSARKEEPRAAAEHLLPETREPGGFGLGPGPRERVRMRLRGQDPPGGEQGGQGDRGRLAPRVAPTGPPRSGRYRAPRLTAPRFGASSRWAALVTGGAAGASRDPGYSASGSGVAGGGTWGRAGAGRRPREAQRRGACAGGSEATHTSGAGGGGTMSPGSPQPSEVGPRPCPLACGDTVAGRCLRGFDGDKATAWQRHLGWGRGA